MPNWCECILTITTEDGYEGELSKFVEISKYAGEYSTDLSLNKTIPIPEEQETNWYEWRIQNWGIKWDVDAEAIHIEENIAKYEFYAAWGPPLKWMELVSKLYPHLEFRMKYDEPGMGFMGVAICANGNMDDKSLEY